MVTHKQIQCQFSQEHINKIQEMLQLKVDILYSLLDRSANIGEMTELKGKYATSKEDKISNGFGYYFAIEEIPKVIEEEFPEYLDYSRRGYSRLIYSIAVDFRDLMCKGISAAKKQKKDCSVIDVVRKLGSAIPDITYVKLHTRSNGVYIKDNNLHIPEYKLVIPVKGYEEIKFKTYLNSIYIKWPQGHVTPIIYKEETTEINY